MPGVIKKNSTYRFAHLLYLLERGIDFPVRNCFNLTSALAARSIDNTAIAGITLSCAVGVAVRALGHEV